MVGLERAGDKFITPQLKEKFISSKSMINFFLPWANMGKQEQKIKHINLVTGIYIFTLVKLSSTLQITGIKKKIS